MNPTRRRKFLRATLVSFVLLSGACALQSGVVTPEKPAQAEAAQAVSHLSRGKFFLTAGEPDLAMKEFIASMSVDGISVAALTGAGIAARQQGLLTSAQRYFEQARSLDPLSVAANNNLGVVLYMLKEYYPAQNAFKIAYALSSGTSETAARNLNRADATIARIEGLSQTDLAAGQNQTPLGANEFEFDE